VFGGAGGQHSCDIATKLGISTIVIHKYSSILSAYGMALADVVQEAQKPHSSQYTERSAVEISPIFDTLRNTVRTSLLEQGIQNDQISYEYYLNMRYKGTETAMMILQEDPAGDFKTEFLARHLQEFSFVFPMDRPILVDDIRVRGIGKSEEITKSGNGYSQMARTMEWSPIQQKADVVVSHLRNPTNGLYAHVFAARCLL